MLGLAVGGQLGCIHHHRPGYNQEFENGLNKIRLESVDKKTNCVLLVTTDLAMVGVAPLHKVVTPSSCKRIVSTNASTSNAKPTLYILAMALNTLE